MEKQNISIKKRWTTVEDNALKYIRQNLHYKSWNMISKKMASDFGFFYRSQKQCRDRYQNYLKNRQNSFKWSDNQQRKLFLLFAKQGSKWQLISSHYMNIKGIHIKNKFYTRVRKAIRQINAVISFNFSKKYKPFNFNIISKLVSLIAKNIQGAKYENDQASLQNLNKNTKTLFQLIELTNPQGYQLFPQLQLQTKSQLQKKKQYKKLIKKLLKIQQSTFFYGSDQYHKFQQSYHNNHVNDQISYNQNDQPQISQNYRQHQENNNSSLNNVNFQQQICINKRQICINKRQICMNFNNQQQKQYNQEEVQKQQENKPQQRKIQCYFRQIDANNKNKIKILCRIKKFKANLTKRLKFQINQHILANNKINSILQQNFQHFKDQHQEQIQQNNKYQYLPLNQYNNLIKKNNLSLYKNNMQEQQQNNHHDQKQQKISITNSSSDKDIIKIQENVQYKIYNINII